MQGNKREARRETDRLRRIHRGAGEDKGGTERDRQPETQTHRGAGKDKGGTERGRQAETDTTQRYGERQEEKGGQRLRESGAGVGKEIGLMICLSRSKEQST